MKTIQEVQDYIDQQIPISTALEIQVKSINPQVEMALPIAKNKNNKDTAFAGSMASGCSLAGWLCVQLVADEHCSSDVFIAKSAINYLKPIRHDFAVKIEPIDENAKQNFIKMLNRKGKAKVTVMGDIISNNEVCARFEGVYAALKN